MKLGIVMTEYRVLVAFNKKYVNVLFGNPFVMMHKKFTIFKA